MRLVNLYKTFKSLSNKQIAILIFVIIFPILFASRIPYFVEGDTLLYGTRAEFFVSDWDMFVKKVQSTAKHVLYFLVLGVFKLLTPFLSTESTMTFFSTFFSSLCVSLTYLLSEKIFKDRKVALISAAMLLCTRQFLYFTLLGEQYTFQSFFMLVTMLLIYEDRYTLAGIVLGISLAASPSCGYFIFAFMYLIWKRSKSWGPILKIWAIPTAIFAPILILLRKYYGENVTWTLSSWWYFVSHGDGMLTGIKVITTEMIDNFILLIPFLIYGCFIAYRKHNEKYREIFSLLLLSIVPPSPLIVGFGTAKWFLPMMPLFMICATIPFKEIPKLKKLFPLLAMINLIVISSLMLVPLYKESISQRDIFVSGEMPYPIIMRWSSGTMFEYYGTGRGYYEIMTVENIEIGGYFLNGILEEHGKVYLYDYTEIQCRPITSLYGVYLTIVEGDQTFTVMDRINSRFDINYSIYKQFNDGTIIWELTSK